MTSDTINDALTMQPGAEGTLLAGRYRIVRQLGQGGMGSVWLAEDTQLDNKQFAIKMLPSILVSNMRAYRQLKDEALVAMKLTHPNIVTLRAFEENNGNPFLVMDYIEGETLDDYLAEHCGDVGRVERVERVEGGEGRARTPAAPQLAGIPEPEVVRLLRPIAGALDYAHGKGVVHRDVKPANVMVAKDGTPYILDFGIAREIQETMTRVTGKLSSGTLLYMSPEQLRGQAPKPAQDVYSFAAMAYECLKGEPPFVRGAIEDQIKNEPPEPLVGRGVLAEPLIVGVMAGLAKTPEGRPATCVGVLEGDVLTQRHGDAEAQRGGASKGGPGEADSKADQSVREPKRRSGRVALVAAVLGIAALAGGGAWYYNHRQEEARIAADRKAAEMERRAEAERKAEEKRKAEEERRAREEAEQKAEQERIAKEEAERKAKEEADRKAKEEAERKAKEEADRKAKEEAERKANKEAEQKAKEEAERKEKEAAERRAEEERRESSERKMKEAELQKEANTLPVVKKGNDRRADAERVFMERLVRDGFILDEKNNPRPAGTQGALRLPNGESIDMVWCPPGWFMMGSPTSEIGRNSGEMQHAVRLTKGFWIGRYEVTRGQWAAVMGESIWFGIGSRKPKSEVSWNECKHFIGRLNSQAGASMRLPTEAEWEYACRAGTKTPFSFGSVLNGSQACCNGGEPYGTSARGPANMSGPSDVGSFSSHANPWGICDMHGNVYEWCEDVFAEYPSSSGISEDPRGEADGVGRVMRGGCWNYSPRQCRSAFRTSGNPAFGTGMIGFRVVCDNLP